MLLSRDEVLAALDVKRVPAGLPSTKSDGRIVYQRDDVRTLLLGGTLPPTDRVPRCRYCGRVSASGWAAMICDRCEKMRAQIETGAMSQFSIADRRGWRGPPTIGDDELLLAIQRRLRDADHRALETAQKEAKATAREKKRKDWSTAVRAVDPANDEEELVDVVGGGMSDAAAPAMPEAGEQPRQPAERQPFVVRIMNPAAFQLPAVNKIRRRGAKLTGSKRR